MHNVQSEGRAPPQVQSANTGKATKRSYGYQQSYPSKEYI